MKTNNKKAIEQIKAINDSNLLWHFFKARALPSFLDHVDHLSVEEYKAIILKKRLREKIKFEKTKEESILKKFNYLLKISENNANTSYQKVLVEGEKNIYYASPFYGLEDYHRSIFWEKNEKTLKLIPLFERLLTKNTVKN
jgi:hypothetical protein